MSVLATFTVPPAEFVLTDTLSAVSDVRIEIKRVVAEREDVTPYFWAAGDDLDAFERALRGDESVAEIRTLEDEGDERLYRVKWAADVPSIVRAASEMDATALEAVSETGDAWEVKFLFPDRAALSSFHEFCLEEEYSLTLDRVYRPESGADRAEYGVTDEQREALEAAYHGGYFNVPRDHTLTELADELDISRNALSARLRRGHRNLLANTLVRDE